MPGSKLGVGARGTVGSESGGRGNRPAKEHVNRKWQVLQQGSTQEGFPQEVTCRPGRGHASTMWPEQGCAGGGWGAVGGEARAGQAWSSCGSALCQDPARSNPSEDPTDSCQRAPMLTLQLRPTSGLRAPLPVALHLFIGGSWLCSPVLPSRRTLSFLSAFHPACLSRLPPTTVHLPPILTPVPGSLPSDLCQAFSKSGFSVELGVHQTHARQRTPRAGS